MREINVDNNRRNSDWIVYVRAVRESVCQFEQYLYTPDAKQSLQEMEDIKLQVRDLWEKLTNMEPDTPAFTHSVLYELLTFHKTTVAQGVNFFPSPAELKRRLYDFNYDAYDLNILANKILWLCKQLKDEPANLPLLINQFAHDKYGRGFTCSLISPLLFCINNSCPIINATVIYTFNIINDLILSKQEKLVDSLEEYPGNISKLRQFAVSWELPPMNMYRVTYLFCHWYKVVNPNRGLVDELLQVEE